MISVAEVEGAAARIAPYVRETPVLSSASLDRAAGMRLALKCEPFQRTGSFKVRGAFNALLQMPDTRAVLAVSSGNHAQAVAHAARALGKHAVIVVPSDANPVKIAAARDFGAEIVAHGVTADNREDFVRSLALERRLPLVHPFDDERVMAGQGTCGLELCSQSDPLDTVVTPVGGGGLLSGVAVAVKTRWPSARVIGVEPAGAADAQASLRAGRLVALERAPDTIADGVRSRCLGERPWAVISRLVDDIVTVTDDQIVDAMELVWTRAKLVVEPSGALPVAAALAGKLPGGSAGLILSGGNVDLRAWARLLGPGGIDRARESAAELGTTSAGGGGEGLGA